MTGPADEIAARHGRWRASHADREQVVGALQAAFVQGRLTADELDERVGQALAARTYAELAALTSDLPGDLAPARQPAPARTANASASPAAAEPNRNPGGQGGRSRDRGDGDRDQRRDHRCRRTRSSRGHRRLHGGPGRRRHRRRGLAHSCGPEARVTPAKPPPWPASAGTGIRRGRSLSPARPGPGGRPGTAAAPAARAARHWPGGITPAWCVTSQRPNRPVTGCWPRPSGARRAGPGRFGPVSRPRSSRAWAGGPPVRRCSSWRRSGPPATSAGCPPPGPGRGGWTPTSTSPPGSGPDAGC